MAHEDVFLSFVRDALDSIYHTNIFTHLEGSFSISKLKIFETLFSKNFIEALSKFLADLSSLEACFKSVDSKIL
jgi:hypothetical protein